MTFLALTSLQAALLALVTAGIVVSLYLLKVRHRRVMVASSMLWQRVLDEAQAHSLWEKLRKYISILVAVTIGLLIALAIGRPDIPWLTGQTQRVLIVLDTSPSMLARRTDGRTRWQHAVGAAQSLLGAGGASMEFRVADTSGRFDTSFTRDRTEAWLVIGRMQPAPAVSTHFPEVTEDNVKVYFITDGVSGVAPPSNAGFVSVYEPADNVGITAFEIRSMPSTPLAYEAYLEVYNYGQNAATVEILLSGTGNQRITRRVELGSGEKFEEPFDLSPFEGGGIRATVRTDGDAFALDDIAYAYLPVNRRTRTLLVTVGNAYLETVLKLDSLVDLTVVNPATFRDSSSDFDVYIFDRYAPPQPPSRPALIVGTPNVGWLRAPTGLTLEPTFKTWMEEHPVMQFVSLHDVSIQHAGQVDPSNLTVIAASDNTPLILASERPKWIMLTFDLQSSDFSYHAGFPVFIENALAWLSRERLALSRTPGVVEVPMANSQIRNIDGTAVDSQFQLDRTMFETSEPGLYLASQGDNRRYIAVNLASRRYSNVNRSARAEASISQPAESLLHREPWFYMLCAAVVLISVEWFTYHRRITL